MDLLVFFILVWLFGVIGSNKGEEEMFGFEFGGLSFSGIYFVFKYYYGG